MGKTPNLHSFFLFASFCSCFRSFDALFADAELGVFDLCSVLICGFLFIDASITVGDVGFEPLAVMRSTPVAIVITRLRFVLAVG